MTGFRFSWPVTLCAILVLSMPARPEADPSHSPQSIAAAPFFVAWQDGESGEAVDQVHARKLSGYVHMAIQKETALSQVLVEECDPSWNRVLDSTKTDYQGHFNLKPARRGKVHYLRIIAKGFGTSFYQITLSPDAPPELMFELRLASKSQDGPSRKLPGNSFAGGSSAATGIG